MSYIGKNPRFNTIGLRPLSADPTPAVEGQMQYADGTARSEGVWIFKDSSWQKIGSAGTLNFDEFGDADSASLSNFITGNSPSFGTGGSLAGTFAFSTAADDVINGIKVFKYTQAGGSLNDYISRNTVSIPQGFRGRMMSVQLQYKYNGNDSDLAFIARNQTTNSILFTYNLPAAAASDNIATNLTVSFIVPPNCQTLAYGFQVKTLNSGKVLIWDDAIVAPTDFLSQNTQVTQGYVLSQSSASMTQNGGNLRFNLSTATVQETGDSIIGVFDNALGTRLTASAQSSLQVSISAACPSGSSLQILKNGTVITEVAGLAAGNVSVDTNLDLIGGDYVSFRSNTGALTGTVYLSFSASALSTSVIVAAQEFSTEKNRLTFKATAITADDPIGTFNTYTYASGGNVATISATAPTQNVINMQQNGVKLRGRAYNASSTSADPARVDIKIGPGLKNVKIFGFNGTGLGAGASFDRIDLSSNGTVISGIDQVYDSTTGVITLTAGLDLSTLSTTRYAGYTAVDGTTLTDVYFTFSASRKPELIGIPVDRALYAQLYLAVNEPPRVMSPKNFWAGLPIETYRGDRSFATTAGNQITLPAGTYRVHGYCTISGEVQNFQIRLRNITNGITVITGPSVYLQSFGSNSQETHLDDTFTSTATATYQFQFYQSSSLTGYFGSSANPGFDELRTMISYAIEKVS